MAPYCNVGGVPSWCSHSWCCVNASNCALSASPSVYAPGIGLHYSYDACATTDNFTSFYTYRDGVINLCSVFSEHGSPATKAADGKRRTCGSTDTYAQADFT